MSKKSAGFSLGASLVLLLLWLGSFLAHVPRGDSRRLQMLLTTHGSPHLDSYERNIWLSQEH